MILKRVWRNESATYGVLIDDVPFAVTLELPWKWNKQNLSCIPEGRYFCKRIISPRFGKVPEVTDVPGRSHILIHTGNIDADTKGCIIIGEQFENIFLKNKWWNAILQSRKAFKELTKRTAKNKDGFWLEIVDCTKGES